MPSFRKRRGVPRVAPEGGDPDVQVLYDSIRFQGVLEKDPLEPRDGDTWVLDGATPELRVFIRKGSAPGKKYKVALTLVT